MRYKVKIEGRTFEAEVGNVDARPIVVMVEGERFEVWPERLPAGEAVTCVEAAPKPEPAPGAGVEPRKVVPGPAPQKAVGRAAAQVRAPIPGVIESVAVRSGDEVAAGDPLCVIEAMKMKNIIRAPREATVDHVLVTAGQHVKHNDVLVTFSE